MRYDPLGWFLSAVFVLAIIGALSVIAGTTRLIVWLIMHVRFA